MMRELPERPCGLFVTGTDTGVGKTVVAAAIVVALKARGLRVGVMKPAESGCRRVDGALVPEDALFLRAAAGSEDPMDLVNLYAFEQPLAPALAAELEGVSISLDRIRTAYERLAGSHDLTLVEGAGGLLVPLAGALRMADLAWVLGLGVLVVARNVLGAINHTALTVEVARARGLRVVGVVLNNPAPPADRAVRTNAESLRRWANAPFLGEMPFFSTLDHDTLGQAAEKALDLEALLGALSASASPGTSWRST